MMDSVFSGHVNWLGKAVYDGPAVFLGHVN